MNAALELPVPEKKSKSWAMRVPSEQFRDMVNDLAKAAGLPIEKWLEKTEFYRWVVSEHAKLMAKKEKESLAKLRQLEGQSRPKN